MDTTTIIISISIGILIIIIIVLLCFLCKDKKICCFRSFYEAVDPHEDTNSVSISDLAPEISGIENTGSSCYLNSMIQILASSEMLLADINRIRNERQTSRDLDLFIGILEDLNKPHSENIHEHIHEQLQELMVLTGWNKLDQQDAFELLCKVINSTEKSMDGIKLPLKVQLQCVYTGLDMRSKPQYYMGLSVGLCGNYQEKPGVPLKSLINNHFETSNIDGDPNKTMRFYWYRNIPSVLLIHVQANKFDSEGRLVKSKYFIKYEHEMTLDCEKINDKDSIESETKSYHLVGIVEHMGTIDAGHYFCFRKYNNKWYLISDTQVEKKSKEELSESPYLLLYEANE